MPTETVLITGASSGIGLEFAKLFAADGSRLILTARSEDRLNELAATMREEHGVEVLVFPENLADPDAPQRLYDAIEAAGLEVDVLVNNAGFGRLDWFSKLRIERHMEMIQVNVSALTQLAWLFLRSMRTRNRGNILNVASTAAFFSGPHMGVYYATKSYVLALSEAISDEQRPTGVNITCLCPGPTVTEFADKADMAGTWLFTAAMPAERVAQAGYRGMRKGKVVVVPGLRNKLITLMPRLLPRKWVCYITGQMQRVPKEPPTDRAAFQ